VEFGGRRVRVSAVGVVVAAAAAGIRGDGGSRSVFVVAGGVVSFARFEEILRAVGRGGGG